MDWYLVKLIFSIDRADKKDRAEFDEQLRLISANTVADAYLKAKVMGQKLQGTFYDDRNARVIWNFVDVAEVILLGEIEDGAEIYSNTLETEEKENFINSVRRKGMAIQAKSLFLC
jgi:hypothetical protein